MIDDFLKELFPAPEPPASFGDRFGPTPGGMTQMLGGTAPRQMPLPMPRPRPNIEAILSGGGGGFPPVLPPPRPSLPEGVGDFPMPPNHRPNLGAQPPWPSPPPPPDIDAILGGRGNDILPTGMTPNAGPAPGPISAMLSGGGGGDAGVNGGGIGQTILNILRNKGFKSSIAKGMSGGNPNFQAGAFMKGLGGSMTGGLESDKEDRDETTTADDRQYKRGHDAQRLALEGRRTTALEDTGRARTGYYNARSQATAQGPRPNNAWNKPAGERWKDAQKLIMDFDKQVDRLIASDASDVQRAQAQARKDRFRLETLQKYGFDDNGKELSSSDAKGLTFDDPHIPANMDDFAKIKTGQYYINPADGEVYIKKNGEQP